MTNLGGDVVWQNKKYVAFRHVSGDLSYSIGVKPKGMDVNGIKVNKMSDIPVVINLIERYGFHKAYEMWSAKTRGFDYRFGYLKGASARKYAKVQGAYGDYAKKFWGL